MSNPSPPPFHMMTQSYVPHVASAIPPPAYTEAHHDDLAAQLEQMKAMMEQMRLDKERLEMDAKRKAEEGAMTALRAKQEMEAVAAHQKEKKELDGVFKLFTEVASPYSYQSSMEYLWKHAGEEESKFLKSLEESGETILLAYVDQHARKCGFNQSTAQSYGTLRFVLTNCHLYDCVYNWVKTNSTPKCEHCKQEYCVSLKTGTFYASPLYSFTNPLKLAHAKILLSIMAVPKMGFGPTHPGMSIWNRVYHALGNRRDGFSSDAPLSDSLKKFESIIRLIPGGYKNGDWKQMDGFFGVYFNETAMEVSEIPPPSL